MVPFAPPKAAAPSGKRHNPLGSVSCQSCGLSYESSSVMGRVETLQEKKGNPLSRRPIECLKLLTEELNTVSVPVKQAAPVLSHTLGQLRQEHAGTGSTRAIEFRAPCRKLRPSPVPLRLICHGLRARPISNIGVAAPSAAGLYFGCSSGCDCHR